MAAPLRILHLVSYPLWSGPVPPTVALAEAQRRTGHRVWLAADTRRRDHAYEEPAAPALAALDAAPPLSLELSTRSGPLALRRDLTHLRALAAQVDVVHVHTSHDHALAAAARVRRRGARLVRTIHAGRSLAPRLGQRWLLGRAAALIVRSEAHARRLEALLPGTRPAVIPGSVDAARFQPPSAAQRAAARARFGLPAEAKVVVHVALIADRGQAELCAALAQLEPRLHVLFVGEGEGEAALRRAAAGLGERVHFAGYLRQPELPAAYHAADAAFLAQAGNDASARAALEAMATGLPVIAVAHEALGELVTARFGYPIAGRDPGLIGAGLSTWLADAGAAARGQAGRDFVSAHRQIDAEARATDDLYATALGPAAGA